MVTSSIIHQTTTTNPEASEQNTLVLYEPRSCREGAHAPRQAVVRLKSMLGPQTGSNEQEADLDSCAKLVSSENANHKGKVWVCAT